MSTQIVIMNRKGLAMCSDSALTVPGESGQHSVSNMGRKLFQVTGEIGFMNYNAMSHCGLAIEVLIKEFRKRIKGQAKATVSECAQDFLQYLESMKITRNSGSKASFNQLARDLASEISMDSGSLDTRISRLMARVRRQERLFQTGNGMLAKEDQDFSAGALQETMGIPAPDLAPEAAGAFSEICLEAMSRRCRSTGHSGLVFAGFGKDENFACVEHWIIDGTHEGKLRHWKVQESCVDLNTQEAIDACVTPFAQRDVADLLMSGFDHDSVFGLRFAISDLFMDVVKGFSSLQLDEEAVEREIRKRQGFVEQSFYNMLKQSAHGRTASFLRRVAKLEPGDLADLAKTFVEATSVSRMIDADLRTVGGPINVSLITKSDGFERIGGGQSFRLLLDSTPSITREKI